MHTCTMNVWQQITKLNAGGKGWTEAHSQVESSELSNSVVVWSLSRVQLSATSWTAACQAPLSMEFSRQEYWSGLPFPSPGDLPNPEIKSESPALAGRFFSTEPPGKPPSSIDIISNTALICIFPSPRAHQHFLGFSRPPIFLRAPRIIFLKPSSINKPRMVPNRIEN